MSLPGSYVYIGDGGGVYGTSCSSCSSTSGSLKSTRIDVFTNQTIVIPLTAKMSRLSGCGAGGNGSNGSGTAGGAGGTAGGGIINMPLNPGDSVAIVIGTPGGSNTTINVNGGPTIILVNGSSSGTSVTGPGGYPTSDTIAVSGPGDQSKFPFGYSGCIAGNGGTFSSNGTAGIGMLYRGGYGGVGGAGLQSGGGGGGASWFGRGAAGGTNSNGGNAPNITTTNSVERGGGGGGGSDLGSYGNGSPGYIRIDYLVS